MLAEQFDITRKVEKWILDRGKVSTLALTKFSILYASFSSWSEEAGQFAESAKAFSIELSRLGFRRGFIDGGSKAFRGIAIKRLG